jgi:hypothetical protein
MHCEDVSCQRYTNYVNETTISKQRYGSRPKHHSTSSVDATKTHMQQHREKPLDYVGLGPERADFDVDELCRFGAREAAITRRSVSSTLQISD